MVVIPVSCGKRGKRIEMAKPFVTEQTTEKIKVEITAREAHLLKVIRKYPFGKIVIHKANGILVRVEPTESTLLDEKEGLDLAIEE